MKSKIKIKRGVLILLIIGILYGSYYLYVRLPIINGYAAKNVCSCVFLAKRNLNDVEENELNFSFLKFTTNKVDTIHKTVTSSFFGLRPKTAYYNPLLGCALINDKKNASTYTNYKFTSNKGKINLFSFAKKDDPKLKAIGDAHFIEKENEKLKNTIALLIIHHDTIKYERYDKGFHSKSRLLGWSMAKSITSTLVGVLENKGTIDIKDKVEEPEWKNDSRKEITWNHLLQMTSGLEWEENYASISSVTKMLYDSDDVYTSSIEKPLEHTPGTFFEYSSGTTNVLSGQIKKQFPTKEEYWRFPYEELFYPIGAESMVLEADPKGTFIGSSYAWATARDWAKYGRLYLNKGRWNGIQLLTEKWVTYTVTPVEPSKGKYGAQFWLSTPTEFPDIPQDMYFADGFQGQRIFIIPSKDLLVIRFGLSSQGIPDFNHLLKEIIQTLE